jgi:hypothetical protein
LKKSSAKKLDISSITGSIELFKKAARFLKSTEYF